MGNKHYKQLTVSQKISICKSIHVMTERFWVSYNHDLSFYENDDVLLNDLYFYWLRMSAMKGYAWCKEYEDFFLSSGFADEMKHRLKTSLLKLIIKKRRSISPHPRHVRQPALAN